jgi:cysteine synthase
MTSGTRVVKQPTFARVARGAASPASPASRLRRVRGSRSAWLALRITVESILEAIGNTPLVPLSRCAPANGAELWVKLEYRNPTGSMKDRMALAMIEGAERDGLISQGDTIVEYTGGSTGPALALVCRAKGYRALIVIADCFTEERTQLMRALGAELDVIPSVEGPPKVTAKDIDNMVARSAELAQRPGHYATDQFNNPYIIPDHRDKLGREIWEQTDGRVTAFCQGMGTASSLMGVSDALKPHGVFIQAHEPAGSAAISGGERGSFLIQGWTGGVMPHWHPEKVDHLETIGDDEALAMTRRLAREEGVFAGISTGANVVGAHRLAERLGPDAVIVTLAVDTGFKYMSVAPYDDM